jgi:D-3-phosphoglycerate dehydrogenase / 2-oxoglutarate reductase
MKKVIFLDTVHPILAERLTASGEYTCIDAHTWSRAACEEELYDAYGIVIRSRFPMDESLLRFAPELAFIARSGAGMENIDEQYCLQRGITLFNAPEGNRNAVGEHALGMLLTMMNNIVTSNRDIRLGIWDREGNRGMELDGKTVGIIGYGNNGSAFAQKLRGFDVKVLAYDKYKENYGDDFVMEATLEAVLRKSDVISFHIPQNEETIHFANQEFFDGLGKSIFLLNLSRGKIVETKALIQAIETGAVVGAGLDVNEFEKASFESFFDSELPAELSYLLHSDRVLLTPHVGGWTHESYFKLSDVLADKILADSESY